MRNSTPPRSVEVVPHVLAGGTQLRYSRLRRSVGQLIYHLVDPVYLRRPVREPHVQDLEEAEEPVGDTIRRVCLPVQRQGQLRLWVCGIREIVSAEVRANRAGATALSYSNGVAAPDRLKIPNRPSLSPGKGAEEMAHELERLVIGQASPLIREQDGGGKLRCLWTKG